MPKTTWKPHEAHGDRSSADKNHLPANVFAFPDHRKERRGQAADATTSA